MNRRLQMRRRRFPLSPSEGSGPARGVRPLALVHGPKSTTYLAWSRVYSKIGLPSGFFLTGCRKMTHHRNQPVNRKTEHEQRGTHFAVSRVGIQSAAGIGFRFSLETSAA